MKQNFGPGSGCTSVTLFWSPDSVPWLICAPLRSGERLTRCVCNRSGTAEIQNQASALEHGPIRRCSEGLSGSGSVAIRAIRAGGHNCTA